MKTIIYYLLLLVLLALTFGYILSGQANGMTMVQLYSVSALLVAYTVGVSLVGEIKNTDERDLLHRDFSNRMAHMVGSAFLVIAILFQLFSHHTLDVWLITTLVVINLTKIISLIYASYKK